MNKKDEIKIEVLSNIKEEIIDKQSAKRYALMTKKRAPRWVLPSSVAAVILVAIMVPILILLFAKQVPIYEGMTVSNYKPSSSAENVVPENEPHRFSYLSNTNGNNGNGDNGNHYGQNKKPVDEIIEEDTSIGIEIPEQPMYYAKAGQEIYITVHVSNPDSFEILSFTLNGKKYSSYMFEEGSDMENLILKVTVPADAEGVIDYTIDAIKYVDGTDIKDVDMRGEKTVKVGVYTSKQPKATVSEELVRINDVSFDVTLSDQLGLIERCGGMAFAVIVDGESILSYEEITVGDEHIIFEGLDTYTSYRYGVVAYYDALDGKGMDVKILFEKEFTTQSVVAPDNIVKTQTSIEFGLIFNELYEDKNVTSMSLYHGEDKVKDFDLSGDALTKTFSATELLSNNEYTIVISYTNAGATETVEFKVTTEAKATPDLTVTETEKTQTSFKFDIAITDIDAVGAMTKIELVHGEDVTNVEDLTAREFTELLSNNDYTVKVTYTYDLNDGIGDQTLVKELAVKTEEKVEPTFTLKDVTSTRYEINGSYDQTNDDSTLISYVVELYKGGELIKENTDKKIEFDSLDYYTEYTVKITYTFDVNDGKGVQTKTVEQDLRTTPYMDVTSTTILDKKDAYFDGDKATLRINIDNPLAASVEYVIIDGKTYAANDSSTTKIILVDVEDVGGLGSATVEGFIVSIDSNEYTVKDITQTKLDILIIGKMLITSWEFVDESFKPIEYASVSDKVYLVFTADKLAGNTVTQINVADVEYNTDDIKTLDDGRFYVELKDKEAKGYRGYPKVTYKNDYIDSAIAEVSDFAQHPFVLLNSTDVRYVSTPQEFMAMEDGYYYELTCDLDFSEVGNWEMRRFFGIIDGKEYAIKNLLLFAGIGAFDSSYDYNSGMFTCFCGIMQNIRFESFIYIEKNGQGIFDATGIIGHAEKDSIIRNCTIDETSEFAATRTYTYLGGICGWSEGVIENCESKARITFSWSDSTCFLNPYHLAIGGVCGSNDGVIENCISYATIKATGATHLGGICGASYGTIKDCTSYAKITGSADRQGGICGENQGVIDNCENYTTFTIDFAMSVGGICAANEGGIVKNCINHANITSSEVHGLMSLAGICGSSSGEIENCTNHGNISGQSDTCVGGIFGIKSDDATVENCEDHGTVTIIPKGEQ